MKKSPPNIALILELSERPSDIEYNQVGTTGGIGTWHRLWAAICVQKSKVFGDTLDAMLIADQTVNTIRQEFDRLELFAEEHSANLLNMA